MAKMIVLMGKLIFWFGPCALGASALQADQLLVSGFLSNGINLYDGGSGQFVREFDGVLGPQAMRFGPDGCLYVAEENRNRILRYDGTTGVFLSNFVVDRVATPEDETGGLEGPTACVFGPDGNLYVASFMTDSVLRYDGSTGEFIDVFVSPGSGGLNGPDTGMIFGPDGHLYVPSFFTDRILRYDGATGAFLDTFVARQAGGLRRPRTLIFHTDGFLYVTSETTNSVLRFDGTTGQFDRAVVSNGAGGLFAPTGMEFGPDGKLYVASLTRDAVVHYDSGTFEPLGDFVAGRSGGLDGPTVILFAPEFKLRMEGPTPGRAGEQNDLVVTGATPDRRVLFGFGMTRGSVAVGGCAGVSFSIPDARLGGRVRADAAGQALLTRGVPARLSGATVLIQAFERETCRVSEVIEFTFP